MNKTWLLYAALLPSLLLAFDHAEGQGTVFTYNGHLLDSGTPANGPYDMQFTLFDDATATGVGHQAGTPNPNARLSVAVNGGVFTSMLDFGPNAFTGPRRWLEISVRSSATPAAPFTLLSPRQELTPTPYAILAETVEGGSISATQLKTTGAPGSGQVLAFNGTSLAWVPPASGGLALPYSATASSSSSLFTLHNSGTGPAAVFLGQVGIGTTTPTQKLDVNGGIRTTASSTASSGTGVEMDYGTYPGTGRIFAYNRDLAAFEDFGIGDFGSGKGVVVRADGRVSMVSSAIGNPIFGTTGEAVAITNTASLSGGVTISYSRGLTVVGDTAVGAFSQDGSTSAYLGTSTKAGLFYGDVDIRGQGWAGNTGSPEAALHAVGLGYGISGEGNDIGVYAHNPSSGKTAYLATPGLAGDFYGDIFVHGAGTLCALTITGGCDLSEPFRMSTPEIPQGAVVVIDDQRPGQLRLSERAYDTRVAGIVSGAHGINSGISLHQEGLLEGGQNVALSGRVYALADASTSSINPGDLLTTSSTPGHCMKVTDHLKAQGAIIGKAMSALETGKGMVLVLVSLQ